jgi:hypothetical protein
VVNRGTADKPIWEREYCPLNFTPGGSRRADTSSAPNEMVLATLLTANTLEEGGLVWRVPKA